MKLKELLDVEGICLVALSCIALAIVVAVVVALGGSVYSHLDCEFRPTSERCTVLHERSGDDRSVSPL